MSRAHPPDAVVPQKRIGVHEPAADAAERACPKSKIDQTGLIQEPAGEEEHARFDESEEHIERAPTDIGRPVPERIVRGQVLLIRLPRNAVRRIKSFYPFTGKHILLTDPDSGISTNRLVHEDRA